MNLSPDLVWALLLHSKMCVISFLMLAIWFFSGRCIHLHLDNGLFTHSPRGDCNWPDCNVTPYHVDLPTCQSWRVGCSCGNDKSESAGEGDIQRKRRSIFSICRADFGQQEKYVKIVPASVHSQESSLLNIVLHQCGHNCTIVPTWTWLAYTAERVWWKSCAVIPKVPPTTICRYVYPTSHNQAEVGCCCGPVEVVTNEGNTKVLVQSSNLKQSVVAKCWACLSVVP